MPCHAGGTEVMYALQPMPRSSMVQGANPQLNTWQTALISVVMCMHINGKASMKESIRFCWVHAPTPFGEQVMHCWHVSPPNRVLPTVLHTHYTWCRTCPSYNHLVVVDLLLKKSWPKPPVAELQSSHLSLQNQNDDAIHDTP